MDTPDGFPVKQAHSAARMLVRALREFEVTEEVLGAAALAAKAQAGAEERIRVLSASAAKWEAALEAARAAHAKVMAEGQQQYEEAGAQHNDIVATMEQARELRLSEIDRAVAEALSAGEEKKKTLIAECRSLEGRRDELEQEMNKAREAHAAMLRTLGVKNA